VLVKLKRKYLVLSVGVVAVASALAFVFTSNGRSASTWVFTNVTPSQLGAQGVTLTPASQTGVAVSAEAAGSAATSFQGGNAAMVAPQYMHCVDTARIPALDEDCWVVSINPKGLTAPSGALDPGQAYGNPVPPSMAGSTAEGSQPIPLGWDLVFVDPTGGQVIEGVGGN
jgi:hypothetical protein